MFEEALGKKRGRNGGEKGAEAGEEFIQAVNPEREKRLKKKGQKKRDKLVLALQDNARDYQKVLTYSFKDIAIWKIC